MGGKKTLFYALLLVFLAAGGSLSASGGREDPIELARSLIVEQKYNEALLTLAEAARKDPERMEEAEKLIRRIRNIRGGYNDRYEALIKVLYEDKDVKKALEIIAELESLDTNPNPATQAAILRAKESALFVYNRDLFNEVMEKAAALLAQKNYWGAVELYLGGFSIGRDGFDKAGYGNIVTNGTDAALESLRRSSAVFIGGRQAQLAALEGLLSAAESLDPAASAAAISRYLDAVRPAALLFKTAARSYAALSEQNRRIGTIREGIREDFYLGFTMRFAAGRQNATSPEGIKGAAELLMKEAAVFARRARQRSEESLAAGRNLLREDDPAAAERLFADSGRYAAAAEGVLGLWFEAVPPELGVADPVVWKAVESEAGLYLGVSAARRGASAYGVLAEKIREIRLAGSPPPATGPELRAYRGVLKSAGEDLARLDREWTLFGGALEENPFSDEAARNTAAGLREDLAARRDGILGIETGAVDRIAGLEIGVLNDELAARTEDFRRAETLLAGVERDVEIAGGTRERVVFKYPAESLEILNRLPGALNDLQKTTGDFITAYRNEPPPFRDFPGVTEKTRNAQANLAAIGGLRNSLPAAAARAREGIMLAERFKNEGNRKIAEAESAIGRRNFDAAGEHIRAARQAFSTSLSHQEDAEFRNSSDARLLALDAEIVKALNDLIVVEVRRLLNEGKRLFDVKSFNEAENVLVRAQNRWRTTHVEDEPEVRRWLGYVRNALSVKANRVILETDPLYPEINQLLNLARQDYARGRDLIERGTRREALTYLARAEEKIKQVTLTFPYNQEASVLSLRIAQLKDRDAFAALFRAKFREAGDKIRTNPAEGYRDLLDLEQIDPNFPGLKSAIFETEIALGIRVRPPSQRAIAESETLYGRAAAIVATNNRAQFSLALEQLNRSIELNPNNQRAMDLKDRVMIAVGGQTSVVLSSVAEEQYRQAEKQFIAGNFFEALAIVERLLQNRESRNYPPLLELKRRIESRI